MIYFPQTKATKDAIRSAIGQQVAFLIRGTPAACPTCTTSGYDPVNESSLNTFCTTCSGTYWIASDTIVSRVAHVRWTREDEPNRGVAGSTLDGDCSITIAIDALTADQLGKIKQVTVDSRKLEVYRSIYRGVQERDRVRLICREFGKT
jgi:hypothetical protein